MGMFDYLVCDHPLPDGRVVEGPVWQTKAGPCEMGLVRITREGRLLFEEAHHEEVPEEQRPYFGTEKWDEGGLWRLRGMVTRVIDRVVDTEYHGDVYFYRGRGEWEEYAARFTNGQLQSITPVIRQSINP